MGRLVQNELYKQIFGGKKVYIFMGIVIFFNLLGIFEINTIGDMDFVINAQNYSMFMLATIVVYIMPFFVILVVADMITQEHVQGTLKETIMRPIKRKSVLNAKIIALFLLILGFMTYSLVVNMIFGFSFWEFGEGFVYEDPSYAAGVAYSTAEGLVRTVGGYYVSIVPLFVFGVITIYLAFLFKSSGVTVGVIFGLFILLNAIGGMFEATRPYLIVSYFRELAQMAFFDETTYSLATAFLVLVIYGTAAYLSALRHFNQKDIFY
ncbi:ABC transporter permease [Anaerobacillus sp. MEB173]|uniref:ABC transporter permease n=1 Tax=Anaerobacillus sp. MEB173 TaxID=3383345 RepID=UPI003F8F42C6